MSHDPEICKRIEHVVSLVAVTELELAKKAGGKVDLEAFLHGLAKGAGTCVATMLLAADIPPMLRQSAIMAFLQMTYDATVQDLVELTKPDAGDLADVKPQGSA